MRKKTCYYCGEPAINKEHIPPKCIFDKASSYDPITVPSCKSHNLDFSKDDEWFCIICQIASNRILNNLNSEPVQRHLRGLRKNPKLGKSIISKSRPINLVSPFGIWIGTGREIPIEHERLQRVIDKITRGMFFKHSNNQILPSEYAVGYYQFIQQPDIELDKDLKKVLTMIRTVVLQHHVFEYKYYKDPDDSNTTHWFYRFYNTFLIYTCTMLKNKLIKSDNIILC